MTEPSASDGPDRAAVPSGAPPEGNPSPVALEYAGRLDPLPRVRVFRLLRATFYAMVFIGLAAGMLVLTFVAKRPDDASGWFGSLLMTCLLAKLGVRSARRAMQLARGEDVHPL